MEREESDARRAKYTAARKAEGDCYKKIFSFDGNKIVFPWNGKKQTIPLPYNLHITDINKSTDTTILISTLENVVYMLRVGDEKDGVDGTLPINLDKMSLELVSDSDYVLGKLKVEKYLMENSIKRNRKL